MAGRRQRDAQARTEAAEQPGNGGGVTADQVELAGLEALPQLVGGVHKLQRGLHVGPLQPVQPGQHLLPVGGGERYGGRLTGQGGGWCRDCSA